MNWLFLSDLLDLFKDNGRRFWVVPPPGNRAERRAAAKAARRK